MSFSDGDPMRDLFRANVVEVPEPDGPAQAAGLAGLLALMAGLWSIVGAAAVVIGGPIVLFVGSQFMFSGWTP